MVEAQIAAASASMQTWRPQTRPRYKVDEDSITPLDPELALMINACSGMDKSSRSTYDLRGKTVVFIKQASAIAEGQLLVGLDLFLLN